MLREECMKHWKIYKKSFKCIVDDVYVKSILKYHTDITEQIESIKNFSVFEKYRWFENHEKKL